MTKLQSKIKRMGRRRFLKTLAAIGVSGMTLNYITNDIIASVDLEDEVPRLSKLRHTNHKSIVNDGAPPKREAEFYTIPREEWAVTETAINASSQINDKLDDEGFADRAAAGMTTITRNHRSQNAVVVKYAAEEQKANDTELSTTTKEKLKKILPDQVEGVAGEGRFQRIRDDIPVVFEEVKPETRTTKETDNVTTHDPWNNYDHKYRPVPGGAWIEDEGCRDDKSACIPGTAGTPAHGNSSDEWKIATAAHVLVDDDQENEDNNTDQNPSVYQQKSDNEDEKIGETSKWRRDESTKSSPWFGFDAGTIELEQEVDIKLRLASDDGDNEYWDYHWIYGSVGRDEIADNVGDTDYSLYKQGTNTGRESGTIQTYSESKNAFETDAKAGSGDSGGPHFNKKRNPSHGFWEVYIAGIHYAGSKGDNPTSFATVMAEVENEFGVTV